MIGISLGWNCSSATFGTQSGLRKKKGEGYNTCPFDIMNSNFEGIIKCITEDFENFLNPQYFKLIRMSSDAPYHTNEVLLLNTYYGFIFNHESPGHANLHITENWSGGANHFIDNNFEKFVERYAARIQNFRNYLNSGEEIIFISTRMSNDYAELETAIRSKYPSLVFRIHHIQETGEHKFNEIHKQMKLN